MKTTVLFVLIAALIAATACADNVRCPNGAIVSTGDSIAEVSMKCGQPTFRNTMVESEAGQHGATILINIEEWTYNEGPDRFVHLLQFRNGMLTVIKSLGYGK